MMMREDALARLETAHVRSNFIHYADGFVAKYQRCLPPHIPRHDIARADAAGPRTNENIGRTDRRTWSFFNAYIAEVVVSSYSHFHR